MQVRALDAARKRTYHRDALNMRLTSLDLAVIVAYPVSYTHLTLPTIVSVEVSVATIDRASAHHGAVRPPRK